MDKNNFKLSHLASIFSLAVIIGGLLLVLYLGHMTSQNNQLIAEYQANLNKDKELLEEIKPQPVDLHSILNQEEESLPSDEGIQPLSENEFTNILANENDSKKSAQAIQALIQANYHSNYLAAQDDILAAISNQSLDAETMGGVFLPKEPANYTQSTQKQLDAPLILQKDPQWGKLHYGSNGTESIAENGCAIVSLAMVDSFLKSKEVTPQDVLNWSKQEYYVHNQGTSWTIFSDYAQAHQINFFNHGDNFYEAMQAVQNGDIAIASVAKGYFTEVGHILVIRGYENGNVYVNDPNDDPTKMFSVQPIPESVFLEEGLNYWTFTN